MKKPTYKQILLHPDRDEIINKLVSDYSIKDIHEGLSSRYSSPGEKNLILSERTLKDFKLNYLDFYNDIQSDIFKTKLSLQDPNSESLDLVVKNNTKYRDTMMKLANNELDIKIMIAKLAAAIEIRVEQVFDSIQSDPDIVNTKVERVFLEYVEVLGNLLEKAHKFSQAPADQVIQHNITLQVVDQHIAVFHDVIKEILSHMDLETSLYFMEIFNKKMSELKMPNKEALPTTEAKLAEVKILNETINQKMNNE